MSIPKRDLIRARAIAAQVVRQFGDRYWPIFALLDSEIEKRVEREARIDLCLGSQSKDCTPASSPQSDA